MKNKLIIIGLFILAFLFMILVSNMEGYKYFNNGDLIISEIVTSNNSFLIDDGYYDAVELYNKGDEDINLYGYYLSDEDNYNRKWIFPDVSIKAHSYMVIACSGKNINGDILHTNFKLSKSGGVVTLANKKDKVLSKIHYSNMISDTSYGINPDGDYVYYYVPTLGSVNVGDSSLLPINFSKSEYKISINEFTNNNKSLYKSIDSKYYSVVELYNYSSEDINLKGFYLSNKDSNRLEYKFDDYLLKANDYLVVFLSGLNKSGKEIHTNFKSSNNDNVLILSDNHQNIIDRVDVNKLNVNNVMFKYDNKLYYSNIETFGKVNDINNKIDNKKLISDIKINEVSNYAVELINNSSNDINLKGYKIGGNNTFTTLGDITIEKNSLLVLYEGEKYKVSNGRVYVSFKISGGEDISLFDDKNNLIDEFLCGKLLNKMSYGIYNDKRVIYLNNSIGSNNSSNYYTGVSKDPIFSNNDIYVNSGSSIKIDCDGKVYYTLDYSDPSKNSYLYTSPIIITKDTTIKAICVNDGMIDSNIISRTYFVNKRHDLPVISINAPSYVVNELFNNWSSDIERKVSFTYYDENGSLGTSFYVDMGFSGMDSRLRPQKSLALYLRSNYGTSTSYYPFFKGDEGLGYSSFTLRNSGEDPNRIRIQDTVLTYLLKGKVDIDMQGYRSVVVYINNNYYGLYNMRERLNNDYLYTHYNVKKSDVDLIKYSTCKSGSNALYKSIVNYINNNDITKDSVYNYVESMVDIDSLIDYFIVESFYGNSDAGNIRYWLSDSHKLRFMLYDLDWALWSGFTSNNFTYPVLNTSLPTTYLYSAINISRRLFKNKTFRDKYLSRFAELLNTTFKPDNFNKVMDELSSEIESEIPRHINRWNDIYSVSSWKSNLKNFKNTYLRRYNYVMNNFKNSFGLSDSEYNKLFKG